MAGFRYVLASPRLLIMFGLAFMLGSLGRDYQVTMAAMSQGPLDAGAAGYGALSVAFAVGTVLGGVYAASRARLPLRLLLITAAVCATGQTLSGTAPSLLLFGAAMLPIAACLTAAVAAAYGPARVRRGRTAVAAPSRATAPQPVPALAAADA
ncbi:hypothetical protein [Spirillospora sp. NPDC048824]|uniref:hypothetical protein n=1 Tax=Spirillospora sp. NPDC048824 TaxID=3364526 RepID=UPI0037106802